MLKGFGALHTDGFCDEFIPDQAREVSSLERASIRILISAILLTLINNPLESAIFLIG